MRPTGAGLTCRWLCVYLSDIAILGLSLDLRAASGTYVLYFFRLFGAILGRSAKCCVISAYYDNSRDGFQICL